MRGILVFVAAGALALAQSSGVLVGVITTATGAPVRDTRIALVETSTGERRETTTDELGIYAFSLLPAGAYRLEPLRGGFVPHGPDHVVIKEGEKRSWRVQWDFSGGQ
jgi:hypothetical protein